MDLAAGTVIANHYRLGKPLGRGGMGEVFAAENVRTGRRVAIKLLRTDVRDRKNAVERFRREALAAGRIESDYVTQVLDVQEDPKHGICIVFEMLEGESLIDRLKRTGPLSFPELHPIIEQSLLGLADAHKAGVIHRDLKPSNVFLEKRPGGETRVKLLDFGIAKLPTENTITGAHESLGTFSFMAPEQIKHAKSVDHRADIYAMATMVFQSLTGRLPFEETNVLALAKLKLRNEARPMSDFLQVPADPRVEAFVAKGLARDADARFQTAEETLAAWNALSPYAPSYGAPANPRGSSAALPLPPRTPLPPPQALAQSQSHAHAHAHANGANPMSPQPGYRPHSMHGAPAQHQGTPQPFRPPQRLPPSAPVDGFAGTLNDLAPHRPRSLQGQGSAMAMPAPPNANAYAHAQVPAPAPLPAPLPVPAPAARAHPAKKRAVRLGGLPLVLAFMLCLVIGFAIVAAGLHYASTGSLP